MNEKSLSTLLMHCRNNYSTVLNRFYQTNIVAGNKAIATSNKRKVGCYINQLQTCHSAQNCTLNVVGSINFNDRDLIHSEIIVVSARKTNVSH